MAEKHKADGPSDDAKAKFKAALDAKNARTQAASGAGDSDGTATLNKGPEVSGPTQRMFRRKAGG